MLLRVLGPYKTIFFTLCVHFSWYSSFLTGNFLVQMQFSTEQLSIVNKSQNTPEITWSPSILEAYEELWCKNSKTKKTKNIWTIDIYQRYHICIFFNYF